MGRKKIEIKLIKKTRQRAVTMIRRREGLFKKAYELSELCDCNVAIVCLEPTGKCNVFSTSPVEAILDRYHELDKKDEVIVHKVSGDVTFSEDIILTKESLLGKEDSIISDSMLSDKLGGRSISAPGVASNGGPLFAKKRKSITLNMFNLNGNSGFHDTSLLTPNSSDLGSSNSLASADLANATRFTAWRNSSGINEHYGKPIANAAEDFTLALMGAHESKHGVHSQPSTPAGNEKRGLHELLPPATSADIALDSAYYPATYFSPAYLHSPTRPGVTSSALYGGSPVASPHPYPTYDTHTPDSMVDSYMSADPLHSIYSPQSLAFPAK